MRDMTSQIAKKWLAVQSLMLLFGSAFAWSKLVPQFSTFLDTCGSFVSPTPFCALPNPFLTACLYGSIAFIVALVWSLKLLTKGATLVGERRLVYFLIFCVLFAGSVIGYECALFYGVVEAGSVPVTCTPGVSPFESPCFIGFIYFCLSLVAGLLALRALRAPAPADTSL